MGCCADSVKSPCTAVMGPHPALHTDPLPRGKTPRETWACTMTFLCNE